MEDIRLVGAVSHSGSGERTKGRGGPLCSTAVGPRLVHALAETLAASCHGLRSSVGPVGRALRHRVVRWRKATFLSLCGPAVLRIGATETARKLHAGTKAREDHQATRAAHQAERNA